MKRLVRGLFQFFVLESVVLCLIISFLFIDIESTITLFIFNFVFVSLIFRLNGSINRKLSLLAVGNVIGLFWNAVFFYFYSAGSLIFEETFDALYTIVYPLLNLLWVVPYWSVSLGFLPGPESAKVEGK